MSEETKYAVVEWANKTGETEKAVQVRVAVQTDFTRVWVPKSIAQEWTGIEQDRGTVKLPTWWIVRTKIT